MGSVLEKATNTGFYCPKRTGEEILMAVKLRLARHGSKKSPYYRIVAANTLSRRDGRFIEHVGAYNPTRDPAVVSLKRERISYWLSMGAQPTRSVKNLLNKHMNSPDVLLTDTARPATAGPARKVTEPVVAAPPVKEAKAEKAPVKEAKAEEAAPAKEAKAEEAPVKEAKAEEAAPVKEAKAEEAAPVEEAKAEEAAPVKEAKAEEAAPVEEAPAEVAKVEEDAPVEEIKALEG
jgi:small subunit ribosomal protein S16